MGNAPGFDILVLDPLPPAGWFRSSALLWELDEPGKPVVLEKTLLQVGKLPSVGRWVLADSKTRALGSIVRACRFAFLEVGTPARKAETRLATALNSTQPERALVLVSAVMPFVPFSLYESMVTRLAQRHAGQHAIVNRVGEATSLPLMVDADHRSILAETVADHGEPWLEAYVSEQEEHCLFMPWEAGHPWFRRVCRPEDLSPGYPGEGG